jgi:hypothetical protein
MPATSKAFTPPRPRGTQNLSSNPEAARAREYARAQFGFEAERRRIATKYRTRKSRAIDKLVKGERFKSWDVAAQEAAIKQISDESSQAAHEEMKEAEEAWKRLTEEDDHEDGSDESDVDEGSSESEGASEAEPMEEITLDGGEGAEGAENEDETPVEQLGESFDEIRKRWEKHWQAGIRYYTQVGLLEAEEEE